MGAFDYYISLFLTENDLFGEHVSCLFSNAYWIYSRLFFIFLHLQTNGIFYDNHSYDGKHDPAMKMNGIDKAIGNKVHQNGVKTRANTLVDISMHDLQQTEAEVDQQADVDRHGLRKTIQGLCDSVQTIEKYIHDNRRQTENVEEWQVLAQVLDRVFFILFLFISFVSTLSILLKSSVHD